MRLGCCGTMDDATVMKAVGFDFLEVNIQAVLQGGISCKEWREPDMASLPLPIEAANSLLPASMPVIGPDRDLAKLTKYMERTAKRARKLGIERLVFGSGGARKRPEDVSLELANEQLAEFTTIAADACGEHGVILVIEHLNSKECNMINKLDEARALCEAVNHPNCMGLVDSYHYGLENDTEQAVLDMGPILRHVHLAEPDSGRGEPWHPAADGGSGFDFDDFFCLLRKIGYNERISIEARWSGPIAEKGEQVVKRLREAWTCAGKCES